MRVSSLYLDVLLLDHKQSILASNAFLRVDFSCVSNVQTTILFNISKFLSCDVRQLYCTLLAL